MKHKSTLLLIVLLSIFTSCEDDESTVLPEQIIYEANENGAYQDFLTPKYYNSNNVDLRSEINKFVYFSRFTDYQNPFQSTNGEIAYYTTNRNFGDGIGMGGTSQHHPAIDLHPTNISNSIYAAHDGIVNTYKDSPKYRHYLTITKEIKDSENNPIGKLVSLYAHIDLDLDESQSLQLNGLHVSKGDIVSENLYLGTVGGPHLHFEIRYYKNNELGNEEFYNWKADEIFTTQSSGSWSYGYWKPEVGYGFANPINHGVE